MPYIFGKLWHLAIIWAIRKAFQCILQGVRILLANHTRISPTSDNESYCCFTNSSEFQDSASFIVILDTRVRKYSEIDGRRLSVNTTYLVTSRRLRTDSSLFFRDVFSSSFTCSTSLPPEKCLFNSISILSVG